MGFAPAEVKAMSVFEYLSALEAFHEANNPGGGGKLSESEKDELWEWLQA